MKMKHVLFVLLYVALLFFLFNYKYTDFDKYEGKSVDQYLGDNPVTLKSGECRIKNTFPNGEEFVLDALSCFHGHNSDGNCIVGMEGKENRIVPKKTEGKRPWFIGYGWQADISIENWEDRLVGSVRPYFECEENGTALLHFMPYKVRTYSQEKEEK